MNVKLSKPPYEKEALATGIERHKANIAIFKAEIEKSEEQIREYEKIIAQHEVYEQAKAILGDSSED